MSERNTTFIHVNQSAIKSNTRTGGNRPVVIVQEWNGKAFIADVLCHEVAICDADGNEVARVIHRPDDPRRGARVWIEAQHPVVVDPDD